MMAKRRKSYDDYWWSYESTRPLDVEDGIKAKSVRGKFVKNWWADRWIKALKRLMDSPRLSRGRSYARRGQVMEIEITPGHVASRVQGSRHTPYRVSIRLKPLSDRQWDKVLDALSDQAIFAAQLLNGEMPPDIEEVFNAVQVPLFPVSRGDLQTDCSCPDWANPCKHIAAVYYLLGERLDEDPFLLFELRGRSKTEIAAALRERRAEEVETAEELSDMPDVEEVEAPTLEECLDHYWMIGADADEMTFNITHPQVPLALLKRLGVPDFEGMNPRNFQRQMERAYDAVMLSAMQVAFADSED
ncbi:MAG: SWIM zinc finger family protein [Chloroflexota bacterium]